MWVGGCVQVPERELAQIMVSCCCSLRMGLYHRSRLRDIQLCVLYVKGLGTKGICFCNCGSGV